MDRKSFKAKGLATAIGSMPQTDAAQACSAVLANLPDIPVWPQLPHRSFLENMYVQYSQGFPAVVLDEAEERIWIDRSSDLAPQLEDLYTAYLEGNSDRYAISPEYAAGLHEFLNRKMESVFAVKGQVTGPISFGLTVTDQDRRPLLYDETLADAVARLIRLKAAWMERELGKLAENTIIFLDEPYLASLGSAYVALDNQTVVDLTNEALGGLGGLRGMHCCGNTDWAVLMSTDIDILSFDAYNHGESLALYPEELRRFLDRGGVIAWGIVPNNAANLAGETSATILERLDDLIALLAGKGINRDLLIEQCLITPSCSLASMSSEEADQTLQLTRDVSVGFRRQHNLEGD